MAQARQHEGRPGVPLLKPVCGTAKVGKQRSARVLDVFGVMCFEEGDRPTLAR
jgi:hypothetical protein